MVNLCGVQTKGVWEAPERTWKMELTHTNLYIKKGKRYQLLTRQEFSVLFDMYLKKPTNGFWKIEDNSFYWIGEQVSCERMKLEDLRNIIHEGMREAMDSNEPYSREEVVSSILDKMEKYYKEKELHCNK
jgi:hypothetical protein